MSEWMDSLPLTRRHFLRRLGQASGAVLTTALIRDLDGFCKPEKPLNVVIVGAGLAGLVAAYELEQRGHSVVILEADSKHVGGRVPTQRFADGLYGELGAMRIPQNHELTRHYIKKFGLTLRRFVLSNPEAFYYLRGRRERIKDVKRLNRLYRLKANEREKTPDELWAAAVTSRLNKLTKAEKDDLFAVTPKTEAVRALDQLSLQRLCEDAGLSAEAIELVAATEGQEMEMFTGATETLREELKQIWSLGFDEIVGGTDRLPAAFVEHLKSKPRMGCEVTGLRQDADKRRAAAVYTEAGKARQAEGDFVLCTLPLPVLSWLKVEPAFSGMKKRAIRELNYDSATKVLAVTSRRFWEVDDGIFGGGTFTDLPTGTTYYPSDNAAAKDAKVSAGPGVLLASYSWGMAARRLASLPAKEGARLAIRHLSAVHPQLAKEGAVRDSACWNWDSHRWSGGGFAWFMPGQHSALYRHIVTPEGRIHFAGEHASLTHTWMQGALESGLRAAREILAAV
ncbi:MAG TPA: FAD-dependent oxidoreductase [Gemmataceae bacterium]|jgi:monoamine oxidase|nr:FAD-dependent oxidoreductase [Gemmataceae bacterium]